MQRRHTSPRPCIGVAVGELDGRAVAVSGSYFGDFLRDRPGILRVWDLSDEEKPLPGSLIGHYGGSKALAITRLDGQPVLVSGGFDHTVRAWDLKDSLDRMPDRVEHQTIEWLQACELGGRPVVVSKSSAGVSFSKSWVWRKKVDGGEIIGSTTDRFSYRGFSCRTAGHRHLLQAVYPGLGSSRRNADRRPLARSGPPRRPLRQAGARRRGRSASASTTRCRPSELGAHVRRPPTSECGICGPVRRWACRSRSTAAPEARSPSGGSAIGRWSSSAMTSPATMTFPGDGNLLATSDFRRGTSAAGGCVWEPLPAYHERGSRTSAPSAS